MGRGYTMKKAYLFLAYGFEEVEALTAVDLLRRAGVEVITVSITNKNMVTGAHSIPVVADIKLDESSFDDADAIIVPGGQPGVDNLMACAKVIDVVKRNYDEGKLIGAICAAPMLLGGMGLLEGRKATSYPGCEGALKGADISEDKVCADGNIITSRGVGTAIEFALALIRALEGDKKANEIKASIVY